MQSPERELSPDELQLLERKPGRSFTNPSRPLGEELITRADPTGGDPEEGVYGRAAEEHYRQGRGVSERAKCVAVLRKADELMAEHNPPGDTETNQRRALELACGRCGVLVEEYDRLVEGDEEVRSLEALVFEAAHKRWHLERELGVGADALTGRG